MRAQYRMLDVKRLVVDVSQFIRSFHKLAHEQSPESQHDSRTVLLIWPPHFAASMNTAKIGGQLKRLLTDVVTVRFSERIFGSTPVQSAAILARSAHKHQSEWCRNVETPNIVARVDVMIVAVLFPHVPQQHDLVVLHSLPFRDSLDLILADLVVLDRNILINSVSVVIECL